jgi:cytochrome b561
MVSRYGIVAKLLHWLIAPLLPGMIAVGSYMTTLSDENPLYFRLLDLHQTTGLLIFTLFFIRIAWRVITPYPKLPEQLSEWERMTARIVHAALLLALAIIPVFGYLFATALGDGIPVYGLFEIPGLVELNKAQADRVINVHMILAYAAGALIALHVLAAIKHRLMDRRAVLKRM